MLLVYIYVCNVQLKMYAYMLYETKSDKLYLFMFME